MCFMSRCAWLGLFKRAVAKPINIHPILYRTLNRHLDARVDVFLNRCPDPARLLRESGSRDIAHQFSHAVMVLTERALETAVIGDGRSSLLEGRFRHLAQLDRHHKEAITL